MTSVLSEWQSTRPQLAPVNSSQVNSSPSEQEIGFRIGLGLVLGLGLGQGLELGLLD